jgi:hypothetical protein
LLSRIGFHLVFFCGTLGSNDTASPFAVHRTEPVALLLRRVDSSKPGTAKKNESDRQTLLEESLRRLLSNFRARIGSWRIVVPLDNLTLPGRRAFRMGNVTFFRFNERRLLKALAQIRAFLQQNPRYADNVKFIDQYVDRRKKHDFGALVGKTCAETEVFCRSDKAFDNALPKIEEAIAGLKLFHYANDDFYGRYFGILGRVVGKVLRHTLLYPSGSGFIGGEST